MTMGTAPSKVLYYYYYYYYYYFYFLFFYIFYIIIIIIIIIIFIIIIIIIITIISIIRRVHGVSYACVYTRGLGTPTASQHNFFGLERLKVILHVLLVGFEPSTFGPPFQRSNHGANPSPLCSL